MENMLQITLVKSPIGHPERQRRILRALGLGKINSSVIQSDRPSVQGMIRQIRHLVRVTSTVPEHPQGAKTYSEPVPEPPPQEGEVKNETA